MGRSSSQLSDTRLLEHGAKECCIRWLLWLLKQDAWKHKPAKVLMWLKAYLTFSDTRAGRGVRMLQESERDINDDWQDGGEGATD